MKFWKFKFLLPSLIAVLVISAVILPFKAKAAESDISVNISPENPAPGENTSITLGSYLYDLNSVLISWSVDGKNSLSGIGQKTFSVNAPSAGGETTIIATVATEDGNLKKTITIRPTALVLLWQADDSYVPPFYEGKALPTPESEIKVVAMPEIKNGSSEVNPQNLLYTWQQDYNNQPDASGYGKNYFIYTGDYLDSTNNISVTASTLDQKYSADANLNITTIQPKILFYNQDPNLGTLFENTLSDGNKITGAEVIQAAPYFISPKDIRIPLLTWNWSINDNAITVPIYAENLLPIQTQAGVSGTSKIDLTINNSYKIFETASKEINVSF
jgi:hypothetical protein